MKSVYLIATAVAALSMSTAVAAETLARTPKAFTVKGPKLIIPPSDVHLGTEGTSAPVFNAPTVSTSIVSSFEGTSDY